MSANVEQSNSGLDIVKWVIAIALLAGAVVANNMFEQESVLIRAVGVVAAVIIAAFFAATTTKGKTFIGFAKESNKEVRKVIWPTRQEATQTTLIIFAATVVIAILLYFLDMGLRWLVSALTGVGI
ncbi:preprotein translocase subunit SecE [Psychrosphaera sp. B3R10]|uniref:Protein translocase subunit SecE n=1 Tax=Psychrosphaera algicola TaxID=3023714 RepID=A0ABT5FF95_9GAMM|nr:MULTISPECIES: preprotein translocase subunit SecE [unclassified Psychrosphaera]MBU2882085.1 preprotein translocase subunit SecE [Psychrosphaera sp. I2R16]MBU2989926.1 preprotein translocase subunit SecE [Psychrosphaera sp. B3R10]MDC2890215.1 preprotein translocase subunit SecE [Psychrosphaera sp. G1-22]MDO6721517.1 preprotein translocase subunit SecE [Psychrosphaera sp. 1_MG-2023]